MTYKGGGVGSIISEDVGILTERSPNILGQQIRKVLSDKILADRFSKEGRARAEENYDYNKLVAKLVLWIEGFLSQKG